MKIFIHRSSKTYGPYPIETIRTFLDNGLASPNDLACKAGEKKWRRLAEILKKSNEVDTSQIDIKNSAEKIKKLVEKEEIDLALDLALGLNSQDLLIALLKDCTIDPECGEPRLPEWLYNAPGFFLELINQLTPESEERIHSSLMSSSIRKLQLHGDMGIENLNACSKFVNIESLELSSLHALENIAAIVVFEKLEELKILSCDSLDSLDHLIPVTKCRNLKSLSISDKDCVESISFFSPIAQLEELILSSQSLSTLEGIKNFTSLRVLELDGCHKLKYLDQISTLDHLVKLDLGFCEEIQNIDCLTELTNLKQLNLTGCFHIEELPSIKGMKNLQILNLQGSGISNEEAEQLEEIDSLKELTLPNGASIFRFPEDEDSGGTLPRIEFGLYGYGLEGYEGELTKAQYEYWKDKDESELIDECCWNEENEEIPEEVRLDSWYEMGDISSISGCQDGTLEVTEYRKIGNGWQKKYQEIKIEDGGSENEEIKVDWIKDDRTPPTGPYFRGYSSEKGSFCYEVVEGKTFEPGKLELTFESVFGGEQGDAVTGIFYDGKDLEWMPEGEGKGFYFEIMPPPEEN